MSLNESIGFQDNMLHVDTMPVADIVRETGTPVYIYSLNRIRHNYGLLKSAFEHLNAHIHYSAKANANISILRALIDAGAGIDAVSAGEIYRALKAGAAPQDIVFAGVGKTQAEIDFAVAQGVGWFNVENVSELDLIQAAARNHSISGVKVALRLNPEVTANTHPYIATGHGAAKFGLTSESIQTLLSESSRYPLLDFAGIHVHIGSQLQDTRGSIQAIRKATDIMAAYPDMRFINIGGGMPAPYQTNAQLPSPADFAGAISPLVQQYEVLIEPGRSIIADAGILVGQVLYTKHQAAQTMVITDASMTELIRPALYQAVHEIVPVRREPGDTIQKTQVVGPVCETADVLGRDMLLPKMKGGDLLAVLTAGAYGMVMASNYNARTRPAEVLVAEDGQSWKQIRRRETWEDLIQAELE